MFPIVPDVHSPAGSSIISVHDKSEVQSIEVIEDSVGKRPVRQCLKVASDKSLQSETRQTGAKKGKQKEKIKKA